MGQQSPFEFAGIYRFKSTEYRENKFHVYVGFSYEVGEFEHYFFYINSKCYKIYDPHHAIYKGKVPKGYPFLKEDSFIGCKNIITFNSLPKKFKRVSTLNYNDIKSVIEAHSKIPTANRELLDIMWQNFEYEYG